MIDRKHIEQVLNINGLGSDSPDDEIRSLLLSARWHENDVEAALVVLREDLKTSLQRVDSYHSVFNGDGNKIRPDTLNALLGIDVELNKVAVEHYDEIKYSYSKQIASLILLTVTCAGIAIATMMWYLEVGMFANK